MNTTDLPTAEVAVEELLDRSSERGYVLLSELQELHVPELHGDAWVDDARLVIANLKSARDMGATIYARHRCVAARRHVGRPPAWQRSGR